MATITSTDTALIGDAVVAIYWMGDEAAPQQYGVCFAGAGFNIARRATAEWLSLASELMLDNVEAESQREREREKVGGPFGIKDATAEAQQLCAEAREVIAEAKAFMVSANRMMAKLEILVNKLVP